MKTHFIHLSWAKALVLSAAAVVILAACSKKSSTSLQGNLRESDLTKDILICKVDYQTFQYEGFYVMNVSGKQIVGSEIPFVAEYHAAGDFGSIKLYYSTKDNLLLDGTIVWLGCGKLAFPDTFRSGQQLKEGLPYPGKERIACLDETGEYVADKENPYAIVADEEDLPHIWQSVSVQKEFQHYYGNSIKKVAVYVYAPAVGLMDPSKASYLIFVEQ